MELYAYLQVFMVHLKSLCLYLLGTERVYRALHPVGDAPAFEMVLGRRLRQQSCEWIHSFIIGFLPKPRRRFQTDSFKNTAKSSCITSDAAEYSAEQISRSCRMPTEAMAPRLSGNASAVAHCIVPDALCARG
ncbi:unnamed protein product [Peronospora effusa]|nr:unnamed protein product [Peronospora effusa]